MKTLTLMFTGDAYDGPPVADIFVDGLLGLSVPITAARTDLSQAVTLQLAPEAARVAVRFNNDAYGGPGKDRNLMFNGGTLDGKALAVPPHLFTRNDTIEFDLPPPPVVDVVGQIAALRADMDADFAAVLGAIKAIPAAAATPPPPAPPAADPFDLHATYQAPTDTLVAGGTITLGAGTYTNGLNVAVKQTIKGAGMRSTILDGRGGIGAGHRLVFGKGILHISADAVVEDIGFINGGGADGTSDGEAAVWCGDTSNPINVTLRRCGFDGGENGVFAPSGQLGSLTMEDCVWGRVAGTGLADGKSHDIYGSIATVIIRRGRFLGRSKGNTIKDRCDALLIEDTYVGRGADGTSGRFLDLPGGSDVTTNRNIYVTMPGCSGGNAFGFDDELDPAPNKGQPGSFTSTDDTFIATTGRDEVFWINHPASVVKFVNPTVKWIGPPGSTPPRMEIRGPGVITGPNPFTYDETNRLDAAPECPPDALPLAA